MIGLTFYCLATPPGYLQTESPGQSNACTVSFEDNCRIIALKQLLPVARQRRQIRPTHR